MKLVNPLRELKCIDFASLPGVEFSPEIGEGPPEQRFVRAAGELAQRPFDCLGEFRSLRSSRHLFHFYHKRYGLFIGPNGAVTGRSEGLRSVLVVSEIALTLVLLTGAGLLLKSFLRMRALDPGFRAENVLTMTVDLPESLYKTTVSIQAFHVFRSQLRVSARAFGASGGGSGAPVHRRRLSLGGGS